MKKILFIIFAISCLSGVTFFSVAQPFTLEIEIKNQPVNNITIGKISGDDFIPLDTLLVHLKKQGNSNIKAATFTFPDDAQTGMYRIILGQTTYAKIMGDDPQQLDFIYNKEDLILETDFAAPNDSLLVVLSEENRIWFTFLQAEKKFQEDLNEVEQEMDYYRNSFEAKADTSIADNDFKWKAAVNNYNSLQKQRDNLITEIANRNPRLFATKMIKMYREPFLDGNLSSSERKKIFQNNFFNGLDFNEEAMINSTVYTDRIFYFLTSYNQKGFTRAQLENEYLPAVDAVLSNTNQNQRVYEFILKYLIHGFEVLKMEKVLDYIKENYS